MIEPYRVNADSASLVELIAEQGLAVVDGLDGPQDLLRLAQSIAIVVPHRDSGPDGVTTIADLGESIVRSGFAGFSACALNPHTDRSGVPHPRSAREGDRTDPVDAVVRPAAGVFRSLLHAVEATARPINFRGIALWFAVCGAASVLVSRDDMGLAKCAHCVPERSETS